MKAQCNRKHPHRMASARGLPAASSSPRSASDASAEPSEAMIVLAVRIIRFEGRSPTPSHPSISAIVSTSIPVALIPPASSLSALGCTSTTWSARCATSPSSAAPPIAPTPIASHAQRRLTPAEATSSTETEPGSPDAEGPAFGP